METITKKDILFNEAKQIVENDKRSTKNMSKEDQHKLFYNTKELIEYSVATLLNSDNQGSIFWGYVFLNLKRNISLTNVKAAASVSIDKSGVKLNINPYIIIDRCHSEKSFQDVINHEGYHLLFNHLAMYGKFMYNKKMQKIINYGTDCEINQHLYNLPKDSVFLSTIKELTKNPDLERLQGSLYYIEALNKVPKLFMNAPDSGSNSNEHYNSDGATGARQKDDGIVREQTDYGEQSWGESTEQLSDSELKNKTKELIQNAEREYKQNRKDPSDQLSSFLRSKIDELNAPAQLNWKQYVKRAISKIKIGTKKTRNRLNRRQPERLDLKGSIKGNGKELYVFVDTSGSMGRDELNVSMNECLNIATMKDTLMHLTSVDTKITETQLIKSKKDIEFALKGGGGTEMGACFEYLNSIKVNKSSAVVIFTDGYIESSIETYGYNNILWVITSTIDLDPSIKGTKTYLTVD